MQTLTVGNLVKNQSINNITPILFDKDLVKPIVLFTILSLNPNRNAFKLMNLNDITRSPDLLSSRIKSSIVDITKLNELMKTLTYDEINEYTKLKFSYFEKFGYQFIQPQILLSEFYKYLGLNYLIIEAFDNRTNNLIGFSNYINFSKKLELITNKAEKTLLKEKYKNFNISKLENYPDFLIVNEWENNYYIDKELYEAPDKCDILDGINMDKFTYTLFGKQQYKLISCIATNYIDPPKKLDDANIPYKIDFDNLNKHTVIYLIDENNSVYVHINRDFSYNTQTKGFIFTGNKKTNVVCNKIYQLPRDDTYAYEFAFNKEKCELKKGVYDDTTFNFSMKKGTRTFIYYKQKEIVQPTPKAKTPPKVKTPPKDKPTVKKPGDTIKASNSLSSLSGAVSINNDFKRYLKEIKFTAYLNDFKERITKYYSKSYNNLINKIITDSNNDIYEENNKILKNKLFNMLKKDDIRLNTKLNSISSNDKKQIVENIERYMKKQRKTLQMKLHIFLTMSFQLLISKIKSRTDKELDKHYKGEYKKEIKTIKKTDNQQKQPSSLSLKSVTSKQVAASPKKTATPTAATSPKKTATPTAATSPKKTATPTAATSPKTIAVPPAQNKNKKNKKKKK
jgi:hypothetical protein